MRFYSLSENPNKPCYVVQFKQLSLMLDCGLDLTTWQHFLPLPVVEKSNISSRQDISRLCSHWSRSYITELSLVESSSLMPMP